MPTRDVVVQLALVECAADGEVVREYCEVWTPAGGGCRRGARCRLSEADLRDRGKDARAELVKVGKRMRELREGGVPLVAHNARFDVGKLQHTAERAGATEWRPLRVEEVVCTMAASTRRVGLRRKDGLPKAPKNAELYHNLVGEWLDAPTLHEARYDCLVTAKSYVLGGRRGGGDDRGTGEKKIAWVPKRRNAQHAPLSQARKSFVGCACGR